MYFDFTLEEDVKAAQKWLENAIEKQYYVSMRKRSGQRTLSQNAYLHVLFNIFSLDSGYSTEEVKQRIFKTIVNRDVFCVVDELSGDIYVRSTAELSKDEMSFCIDRFRNFAAMEMGIYLPFAHEHTELHKAKQYIEKNKKWL